MTIHNPTSKFISDLSWSSLPRAPLFEAWLNTVATSYGLLPTSIRSASADASFRRYFRIDSNNNTHASYIIMDAPPQHEDSKPFVFVANLMQEAGLRAPQILDWNEEHGFLLVTDLGNQTVLESIHTHPEHEQSLANSYFREAIELLVRWQLASKPDVLPPFGESALRRDLNLFPDWYIAKHRQVALSNDQKNSLESIFQLIIKSNLASANVYVHRDFMPRNLMVGAPLSNGQTSALGIIDFQDAVYGPITYDIASLMRDAFHTWDEEFVLDITIRYWEAARRANLPVDADFASFWRAVEWMGLQRHLKILGIFARLTLRDDKSKYLADTPRFIHYVRSTCDRYRDLKPLLHLIDEVEKIEPQYGYMYGK